MGRGSGDVLHLAVCLFGHDILKLDTVTGVDWSDERRPRVCLEPCLRWSDLGSERERNQIDKSILDSPQGFAKLPSIACPRKVLSRILVALSPIRSTTSTPSQRWSRLVQSSLAPPIAPTTCSRCFKLEPHLASTDILSLSCRTRELGPPCTTTASLSSYNPDNLSPIHYTRDCRHGLVALCSSSP